jgi:hypothetical protein
MTLELNDYFGSKVEGSENSLLLWRGKTAAYFFQIPSDRFQRGPVFISKRRKKMC